MTNNKPLRDSPLYKETLAIAEVTYGLLEKLVEDFPEEKWASASKLRNAANDSLYYMSQAVGNALRNQRLRLEQRAQAFILATSHVYLCWKAALLCA